MIKRTRTLETVLGALRLPALAAAAALLALAFVAPAEAAAGQQPKPLKAIVYKRDLGPGGSSTGTTTVYNRHGLKLEASCENPYGTYLYISVADEQGQMWFSRLDTAGGTVSRRFTESNSGTVGINAIQLMMGEIFYIADSGQMLTIDSLQAKNGFGRDCSWSGLVRSVPEAQEIELEAGDGGTRDFEVGDGSWELFCNQAAVVIPRIVPPGSETVPGMLGVNFLDSIDDDWYGRVFSPIATSAANIDSEDAIMDQVLSRPNGSVAAWRAHIGNPSDGCNIQAYGRAVEKGPSRAIYAARTGPGRKKIFDSGGLELFAACRDDGGDASLEIFAKTAAKNSLLKLNGYTDSNSQGTFGPTDFDPQRKPRSLFTLPEGTLTGQLMYSRPDGRVLAMNWSMSGDVEDPKPCQFAGLASSAG